MSQSNSKPAFFRTTLRDWQEKFQARRAILSELKGADEAPVQAVEEAAPAAAAPAREKKLLPRKRRARSV